MGHRGGILFATGFGWLPDFAGRSTGTSGWSEIHLRQDGPQLQLSPTRTRTDRHLSAGTYRLKFQGQGTLKLAGDAGHVVGDTCPSYLSVSNRRANTYVACTFTVRNPGANGGIVLEITAITNDIDHPRDISVVQNALAASYDAGAIFNPAFIGVLNGFSSLRFMEWMKMK